MISSGNDILRVKQNLVKRNEHAHVIQQPCYNREIPFRHHRLLSRTVPTSLLPNFESLVHNAKTVSWRGLKGYHGPRTSRDVASCRVRVFSAVQKRVKRWYENGEQKKWREVERSLEQRRLVMPCNDGEATRRPVLEEEQKLDKRNGEGEGKKDREKERER